MAIQSAKHNGVNFSYDFTRESNLYNLDLQRSKQIIVKSDVKYLLFFASGVVNHETAFINFIYPDRTLSMAPNFADAGENTGEYYFYFQLNDDYLIAGKPLFLSVEVDGEFIYSEICEVVNQSPDICHLVAKNSDNRHGFLTREAFGFFKCSAFRGDFFINKAVTYEYSYSRKKILSSENQIAKRLTFHDLSMYQQNLLKWLCNCETLTINGVEVQLISEITELENDENTEKKSLRADFVEVNQSFFGASSSVQPKNTFPSNFFMPQTSPLVRVRAGGDFNKNDFNKNDFK